MKNILSIVFSIVSLTIYSQNINDLEKQKATLNSSKPAIELNKKNITKEYDSIISKYDQFVLVLLKNQFLVMVQ